MAHSIFILTCPVQVVPAQRWDIEEYYAPDASRNLTMDVRLAAFVTGFDKFDAAAFRQVSHRVLQFIAHISMGERLAVFLVDIDKLGPRSLSQACTHRMFLVVIHMAIYDMVYAPQVTCLYVHHTHICRIHWSRSAAWSNNKSL